MAMSEFCEIRANHNQSCVVVGGTVAEVLFRDDLCLPSGTAMSEADLVRVIG